MKRKNSTRNALVTSVISLLLCVSMLVGTTFAWFTDSVTSSGNIIKSGNLDVEMYWADGTEDPDEVTWKDASEGAIFNYDLWEPGYTQVRHIKIANEGTLALKYQLKIVANGQVSDLADVIDVYYTDPAAQVENRTDLKEENKLGTLTEVLNNVSNTANGNLLAGDAITLTLALKMQEEAGNDYMNLAIGSDFSVVLLATQYTHEEDSFDKNYDVAAAWPAVATGTGSLNGASAVDINAYIDGSSAASGSVNVPAEAVADPDEPIMLTVTPTALYDGVTIQTNQAAKSFDVSVSNIKEDNTQSIKVTLNIGTGLQNVKIFHHDEEVSGVVYHEDTGLATFYTTSFSPFTAVYDAALNVDNGEDEGEQPDGAEPEQPSESNLPKATVVNSSQYENVDLSWGSYGVWSPTAGLDSQLEAAYTFSCEETLDEAKKNPYANWYCDFYVKLDKDLGENQIFLGGNYGSYGWIGFHNGELTLEANNEIPLLGSVTSNPWTYVDVVQNVGTFICGVGDVDDALAGATFTVMLRLTNPADETDFVNVATIEYTFTGSEN